MSLLEASLWDGKIFVDRWTAGGGGVQDVIEPATGEVLGKVGIASLEDVAAASKSAAAAQREWAFKKPEERAAILRRAGDLWELHSAEVQDWIVREGGGIQDKAALETRVAANECWEAAVLPSHPHGEVLTSNEDRWSFARRRPAGVVSVIRSVAPALALGNAVLLKPDPRTAVCGGVALMRIFEEAGLPAGLLQLLPGAGDIGAALVEAHEVRIISFTGSTAAGRKVGEAAARHLKRAHLELGGNNALVVLPGADLAKAASAGAFGSFMHQGQICMTTGRHFVHESLYEQYVEQLAETARAIPVGDPKTGTVALGPIIDQKQLSSIHSIVDASIRDGARVAAGAKHDGPYYYPTVLADLAPSNPAFAQEIFGPVAPVIPFSTLDEAVELINANEYGLSVGILGNVGDAMKIADRVNSGKIHINEQTVADEANAPFGGVGASGNGSRFGGAAANLEAFTEVQWLTLRPEIAPYPF